jgi:hypothetical protein
MLTSIFRVTDSDSYPSWCKSENGLEAPVKRLTIKGVSESPLVEEAMVMVYGPDALKKYEEGDFVLATLRIFVGIDEDEAYQQRIRVEEIEKIDLPSNS